jgi:predicted dehydrogenase
VKKNELDIERILIVGYGSIGSRHLGLARDLFPHADIRLLRREGQPNVPSRANGVFSSLAGAIEFKPTIAVIATPAPFHVATASALASTGCHLLIEKPLADTWSAATYLAELNKSSDQVILLGYNLRFLASLQRFRRYYQECLIGQAFSIRCEIGEYLPNWRPGHDYRKSVSANRELGGGVLLELSHEIDYLRWIFGDVNWVRAMLTKQSGLEVDVEDTAHLIMGFSGQSGRLVATLNLDFVRHDLTRQCTVIGELGTLRWDAITGKVELFPARGKVWEVLFEQSPERNQSYFAEWHHLVACINGLETPSVTVDDGLKVLSVVEAARISSKSSGIQVSTNSIFE